METSLRVEGMKCAGCVQAVEKQLLRIDGVEQAVVNLVTQQAKVELDFSQVTPTKVASSVTEAGFPTEVIAENHPVVASSDSGKTERKNLIQLVVAIAFVVISTLGHLDGVLPFELPVLNSMAFHGLLATLALLWPGRQMVIDGTVGLLKNRPTMDTLVSMGSVTSYLVSLIALFVPHLGWDCFFDTPVMIIGLILLGRTLESQARSRARTSFESLLSLQSPIAHRVSQTEPQLEIEDIPIGAVQPGDRLQVYLGDRFPVDGVMISGGTWVDESMLTGESRPSEKILGDAVAAGTLNQGETIQIEARRTGQETTLARIIRLVEDAQTRKAPIQGLADRVAGVFTYGVMAIALCTFLFWWGIGTHLWPQVMADLHGMPMHGDMMADPSSPWTAMLVSLKLAIAVLVIACPCALGLATPTAILVGTSLGAEQGLIINGGDVLEKCHQLKTIVFDKTGTLTSGKFTITDTFVAANQSGVVQASTDLMRWMASVEQVSRHPLALALQDEAQASDLELFQPDQVRQVPGGGLTARYQGHDILVGSQAFLDRHNVSLQPQDEHLIEAWIKSGKTAIFCAIDQEFVGAIACQDTLRKDAAETIQTLKQMGLNVKVLTGDRQENTQVLLQQLPLNGDDIAAQLSPQEKLERISLYQAQGKVAMVGDGINDAPALAQADVGIALSSGTDMAMETAQIVLTRGQIGDGPIALRDIVSAIELSRDTFRKIKQNLFWAFVYNLCGIPIAAGLLLPYFHLLLSPAAAAALMACSSVSVVVNSLLLQRRWRFQTA